MWSIALVIALVMCFDVGLVQAGAPRGAKALFYTEHGSSQMSTEGAPAVAAPPSLPGPSMPAAAPQPDKGSGFMGVQYWLELSRPDGSKQRVTADRVFRSGDRIKLFVTTNREGYLYLLNIGSSGRSRLIFPHSRMQAGQNFVQANMPYEVPQGGAFQFDANPGEETVLLMLSPQPMNDLLPGGGAQAAAPAQPAYPVAAPMPPAQPSYPAPPPSGYSAPPVASPSYQAGAPAGSGYLPPPPPAGAAYTPEETNRFMSVASAKGAKDLVMETDNAGAQPASYAVAPMSSLGDSGMITLQIKLKHQ